MRFDCGFVGALCQRDAQGARRFIIAGMPYRDPAKALQLLKDGNRRYVEGAASMLDRDIAALRERTHARQRPVAAVLACADARVPVELIFDQAIGSLFVVRVAGNVVSREVMGSLEFAVAMLEASLIVVLGHQACGAVKAAVAGGELPGEIGSLLPYMSEAVGECGGSVDACVRANAALQAMRLHDSTVIAPVMDAGRVMVAPAYYQLSSGEVTWL